MKCVRCGKQPDQDWCEGHEFWDGEESMVVCRECSTHPNKHVMHKDVVAAATKVGQTAHKAYAQAYGKEKTQTIRYSRGYPYGAPLVRLYGQTYNARTFLKSMGFTWNAEYKCWQHYMDGEEFRKILRALQAKGYAVKPKESMRPSLVIDLEDGPSDNYTVYDSKGASGFATYEEAMEHAQAKFERTGWTVEVRDKDFNHVATLEL